MFGGLSRPLSSVAQLRAVVAIGASRASNAATPRQKNLGLGEAACI